PSTWTISKAVTHDNESYSGFGNAELAKKLRDKNVQRLFIGGLATDYCVLNTVLDARKNGFDVVLLRDASRAVNVQPDDGTKAEAEMTRSGAASIDLERIAL
ncbi:MAG: isochorismatase hydrolase, partial [Verrucomicrobiales bacterium]|nr:isochorismatase hydrolase [Verrucomicrobiales bacterium]